MSMRRSYERGGGVLHWAIGIAAAMSIASCGGGHDPPAVEAGTAREQPRAFFPSKPIPPTRT